MCASCSATSGGCAAPWHGAVEHDVVKNAAVQVDSGGTPGCRVMPCQSSQKTLTKKPSKKPKMTHLARYARTSQTVMFEVHQIFPAAQSSVCTGEPDLSHTPRGLVVICSRISYRIFRCLICCANSSSCHIWLKVYACLCAAFILNPWLCVSRSTCFHTRLAL